MKGYGVERYLYDSILTQNDELYMIFFDSTNTNATYQKIVANNEAPQKLNDASQFNQLKIIKAHSQTNLLIEDLQS